MSTSGVIISAHQEGRSDTTHHRVVTGCRTTKLVCNADSLLRIRRRALAGNAGTVRAMQVVKALAAPLKRARRMKMEPPATRTSRRTEQTIGCGGRFQFQLMAAMHTRGVSFVHFCSAKAVAVSDTQLLKLMSENDKSNTTSMCLFVKEIQQNCQQTPQTYIFFLLTL